MTQPEIQKGRHFPSWIEACVEGIPEKIIPERYRRWAAISAVSGALGRRCWYDWGAYQVYPQQYIILCGPPATGKTAAMLLPYSHVFKRLGAPVGSSEPNPDNPEDDGFGWTDKWKEWELPHPLRWMEGRATTEQLIVDLQHSQIQDNNVSSDGGNTRAEMTLKTDEFGEFVNRYDGWQSRFMTTVWDGHPSSYRTKHQGKYYVEYPAINWIAGATPEEFVKHMPLEALEQGWMSRLMLVWWHGEPIERKMKYKSPDERTLTHLRSDLAQIAKIKGEYAFESEELFDEVEAWNKGGMQPKPIHPKLERYCERRDAHLIKIMMAIAASNHNDVIIKRSDFLQAQSLLLEVEQDMPEALKFFGSSEMGRTSLELASMVQSVFQSQKRGIPLEEFRSRILAGARNPGDVEGLVKAMESAGLIRINKNTDTVWPPGSLLDQHEPRTKTETPDKPIDISLEATMSSKIP